MARGNREIGWRNSLDRIWPNALKRFRACRLADYIARLRSWGVKVPIPR